MTYSLSATKLVTYKQCPQAYSFRYERGLVRRVPLEREGIISEPVAGIYTQGIQLLQAEKAKH